jgi:glycosyltransferase involved in cell wall biosynthesis
MKILIIDDMGFESGGLSTYILNLRSILKERGHIVKILSSDAHPEKKHFNDYKFRGINENSIFRVFPYIFNINALIKLKQVLKEFNPDVVHINSIFYHSSPAILIPLNNTPNIMTLHDYKIICPATNDILIQSSCQKLFDQNCMNCVGILKYYPEKLKMYIFKKVLKNIDMFISPSISLKDDIEKNGINNINIIHHGINLLNYSKIKKRHTLLYVGRLSKEKGIEYLIKAMPIIIKKIPQIHLNIVGYGPERGNLENLTKQLKIKDNVTFFNQVPNNSIEEYYKKSSVIIVPSIWPEPFGLIGPEAMSVGRPIIATNIGGIPEWLENGKTGYLVPPRDSNAISKKVIQLISNHKLMDKMGNAGRKKAENEFDIKLYVKKIEKKYQEVINKHKSKK